MREIDGRTRVCAIFGEPVDHSLSPIMQNAAFQRAGLNLVYVAFPVSKNQLPAAMQGLRSMRFVGANITAPNKELALKFVDRVDNQAGRIGAINTVVNNGKLIGYNTDGRGAVRALKEARFPVDGAEITIMGAGGAAKAIAHSLSKRAKEIRIFNRTPAKARVLAKQIRTTGGRATAGGLNQRKFFESSVKRSDLFVQATPLTLGNGRSPIPSSWLHDGLHVFDVVYRPARTKLIRMAEERGLRAINGLGMLLHQGVLSFEIWTGKRAPLDAMRSALKRARASQGL